MKMPEFNVSSNLAQELTDFFDLRALILFQSNEQLRIVRTNYCKRDKPIISATSKKNGVSLYFKTNNFISNCWTTDVTDRGIRESLKRCLTISSKIDRLQIRNNNEIQYKDHNGSFVHKNHQVPFMKQLTFSSQHNIDFNSKSFTSVINPFFDELENRKLDKNVNVAIIYRQIDRKIVNSSGNEHKSKESYFSFYSRFKLSRHDFPIYLHMHTTDKNDLKNVSSLTDKILEFKRLSSYKDENYDLILSNNAALTFLRRFIMPTIRDLSVDNDRKLIPKFPQELNLLENPDNSKSIYTNFVDDIGCPARRRSWIKNGEICSPLGRKTEDPLTNNCTGSIFRPGRIIKSWNGTIFPLYQRQPEFSFLEVDLSITETYKRPLTQSVENGIIVNYLSRPFKAKNMYCFIAFNNYVVKKGTVSKYIPQFYIMFKDPVSALKDIKSISKWTNVEVNKDQIEILTSAYCVNNLNAFIPHIPVMD